VGLRLLALQRATPATDRAAVQRVSAEARELRRHLHIQGKPSSHDSAGLLLAFAYPDRIGQKRTTTTTTKTTTTSSWGPQTRFLLRNGRGVAVDSASALGGAEYIVAAEVDDRGAEGRVFLGATLERADLEQHFADQFQIVRETVWDAERMSARARERVQLGALIITERSVEATEEEASTARMQWVRRAGVAGLRWSDHARSLRARLAFLHDVDASWPDVSDDALLQTIDESLDAARTLEALLTWQQRALLDEQAPTHVVVPSGSRLPIDYTDAAAPALAVRLQEVFGWRETPRLAGGRVPLTLHLLSPAQRPVQVTRDLASFWRTGYFDVKKDLKGRYPKHYWPDDPLTAEATRRARPRSGGKRE
jgi:ATP-dependent helicase HrpB